MKLIFKILLYFTFLGLFQNSYAQLLNGSFEFEGNKRNYMVFLPSNYSTTKNFPLVIYLHSYGWTAQQGMDYTQLHQVADTSNFIIVYPSAMPNWNSGVGDNPNFPTPDVNDVGFIDALIDTLSNNYTIDLKRVYACGYSNGGFMADIPGLAPDRPVTLRRIQIMILMPVSKFGISFKNIKIL